MYVDKVESEIQSCAYHLLVLFCDLIQYNIRTITLSTFMNAEHLNAISRMVLWTYLYVVNEQFFFS